jgi:hypothetical protein
MDGTEAADFYVGQRGEYHWLTAGDDVYMGTIVGRCPEIVMGRYLAVTSIDSGEPWLTERQVQADGNVGRELFIAARSNR